MRFFLFVYLWPCLHQFIAQLSRPVIGWWRLWNENVIGLRDDAGDESQVTERKRTFNKEVFSFDFFFRFGAGGKEKSKN